MSGESTTRSVAEGGSSFPSAGSKSGRQPVGSMSSLERTQTVVAPRSAALVRLQYAVTGVLLLLAALAAARLWLVMGMTRTVRIDGPSMAPAWWGAHYRIGCEDCGFTFRCAAEQPPPGGLAVCPNCGFKDNPLRNDNLIPGEQVLVDRWPHMVRSPRRGEVVAATDPAGSDELVVKRVAGLPGERLAIRGGDLFANGTLVRKNLRELAAVRVLVHDSRFAPHRSVGLPERWQSTRAPTGWHRAPDGYRYEPLAPAANSTKYAGIDWLQYHHWLMFAAHSRTKPSPVLDNDSFNQADPREQNAVPDVLVSGRFRLRGKGRLALAATDGPRRFEAIFDPAERRLRLLDGLKEIAAYPLPPLTSRRGVRIEFGLCDQQVLLAVAGREVFRHAYELPAGPRGETLHPLAIGVEGLTLEAADLVVWRDIYHLHPNGTAADWEAAAPLASDAWALLGDNTTVSADSRAWDAGVPRRQILGTVYPSLWTPPAP